jgi:hypothetical protein
MLWIKEDKPTELYYPVYRFANAPAPFFSTVIHKNFSASGRRYEELNIGTITISYTVFS